MSVDVDRVYFAIITARGNHSCTGYHIYSVLMSRLLSHATAASKDTA
jgi:hypothetical protein